MGNIPIWLLSQITFFAAGVLPVFSAGNYTLGAPGNTPSAVGVGAFQEDGSPSAFNVGGIVEYPGYEYDEYTRIKPDIVGPGTNIWSADSDGGYTSASGTSMSSPMWPVWQHCFSLPTLSWM